MSTLYEYYNAGDNSQCAIYTAHWEAQTFTPTTAHKITSVKLKLGRSGWPGTVTVSIRATSGGHPTGGDLCVGTTNGNTLPATPSYEWREITLGAGYNLNASQKYAIVVRALTGGATNALVARYDSTSPTYAGGAREWSGNSGSSWTTYTGFDYMFEDWGEPAIIAPTVTTQAATNVQATTSRLNGQISNDGGEACQYRFRYKKSGGVYSYTTWTGAKTTGQTFYENISGLDKKSLYYFNAQAKNSAGESAWGGQLSFTTLATIPVLTTQAVSDILATTSTGNGTITDIGGENCSKRGVCWNTTGNPTVANSKSEETGSFGTGAFSRPMTGLSPGQHYYVKAYAYNSAGYGYGSQVEFDTLSPVVVTPGTLALSITAYVPAVSISDNKLVTPSTLALTLTTYAPTVLLPVLVTPPKLALSLATFAPSVEISDHITVTPATLALTLTTFIPTVGVQGIITPPTLALTLTTYAPTVLTPVVVIPLAQELVLASYVPKAVIGVRVTPSTLALVLTLYAPSMIVPGRKLALYITTGQYRALDVITTQNRLVKTTTSQYRQVKTITTQNRLVKIITSGG